MEKAIGTRETIVARCKEVGADVISGTLAVKGAEGTRAFRITGELDNFVRALVGFRSKVVLMETQFLTESLFVVDSLDDDDEPNDGGGSTIDLRTINPELDKFTPFIGQPLSYDLVLIHEGLLITCLVHEERFLDLEEMLDNAYDIASDRAGSESERREAARVEAEQSIILRLRSLRTNGEFMAKARSSKTIRALVAFVVDEYPEVQNLIPTVLAREVAMLRDAAQLSSSR